MANGEWRMALYLTRFIIQSGIIVAQLHGVIKEPKFCTKSCFLFAVEDQWAWIVCTPVVLDEPHASCHAPLLVVKDCTKDV